jgi:hypothetical protein
LLSTAVDAKTPVHLTSPPSRLEVPPPGRVRQTARRMTRRLGRRRRARGHQRALPIDILTRMELLLEPIGGEPAIALSLAETLVELGFHTGPRRLTLTT